MIYFLIIFVCVIFVLHHLYFKIKNPFWSHQPVVFAHQYILKWNSPSIIWQEFYIPKFMNMSQITTVSWKKLNKELFRKHICDHFLQQKNICYKPSLEKHIVSYFEKDVNAYVSYYNILSLMVGVITNRTLRILIDQQRFSLSYIDFLCVHRGHRNKNIAPELIQTHEYYQRTRSRKKCLISLFKKEGKLHAFTPLVKYNCIMYSLRDFTGTKNILPSSLSCVKINKSNIYKLIGILEHTHSNYRCFIFPSTETLTELVEKGSIHIYVIVQVEQIICTYFFRETGAYMNSTQQNLECFASLNNSTDTDVFSLGFFVAIQSLIPKFKMLQMEGLGDNTLLISSIERKSICPVYQTPCAYYLYNYNNREIKKEDICILN